VAAARPLASADLTSAREVLRGLKERARLDSAGEALLNRVEAVLSVNESILNNSVAIRRGFSQTAGMPTLSLDLRMRILASYDQLEGTREDIAKRFRVSLGMVKKLLQQRRKTGQIGHRHACAGRKPKILPAHHQQMRALLSQKPDLTLAELRAALQLACSLPAIHYALADLGLTYKKRRSAPANKIVPTSPKAARRGGASNLDSTRRA
jgi:transposase